MVLTIARSTLLGLTLGAAIAIAFASAPAVPVDQNDWSGLPPTPSVTTKLPPPASELKD